jgi:mono/diheme cytochrome c family protein
MVRGALLAALALIVLAAAAAFGFVKATGLSARATPGPVETAVARRVRAWAIPADYRRLRNPVPPTAESVRNGLEHFADHCATCHANDGSGNVDMGKGMFPPAPDMRHAATRDLSDGDLFYIIEHGVRFTGMPAWGTGTPAGEESSWHLVNFIRHLPGLTPDEIEAMTAMNPRSPAEIRQQVEEERFLSGGDATTHEPSEHTH